MTLKMKMHIKVQDKTPTMNKNNTYDLSFNQEPIEKQQNNVLHYPPSMSRRRRGRITPKPSITT